MKLVYKDRKNTLSLKCIIFKMKIPEKDTHYSQDGEGTAPGSH